MENTIEIAPNQLPLFADMLTAEQEQRIAEVKPIIKKLTELNLKAAEHPELRELLSQIQIYIQQGERLKINIPFPIADVDIKGVLAIDIKERVWIKFTRGD